MADTATAAAPTNSTAAVPPQNRFFNSDRVKELSFKIAGATTTTLQFSLLRKIQVVGVLLTNGATAMDGTNNAAVSVTSFAANVSVATITTRADSVSLAAGVTETQTVSTTVADNIVEATEALRIVSTKKASPGVHTITILYVDLAVTDPAASWIS